MDNERNTVTDADAERWERWITTARELAATRQILARALSELPATPTVPAVRDGAAVILTCLLATLCHTQPDYFIAYVKTTGEFSVGALRHIAEIVELEFTKDGDR